MPSVHDYLELFSDAKQNAIFFILTNVNTFVLGASSFCLSFAFFYLQNYLGWTTGI